MRRNYPKPIITSSTGMSESTASQSRPDVDPVLAMAGVGKEIWQEEDGDAFIKRLRDEFTT